MKYPLIAALLLSTTVSAQDFACEGDKIIWMYAHQEVLQGGAENERFVGSLKGDQLEYWSSEDRKDWTNANAKLFDCQHQHPGTKCLATDTHQGPPDSVVLYNWHDEVRAQKFSQSVGNAHFIWYTCQEI